MKIWKKAALNKKKEYSLGLNNALPISTLMENKLQLTKYRMQNRQSVDVAVGIK